MIHLLLIVMEAFCSFCRYQHWRHTPTTSTNKLTGLPKLMTFTIYGGDINFHNIILQVQNLLRQSLLMLYPWIKRFSVEWPAMMEVFKKYKPKLYYHSIIKVCSPDEACRGNLRMSACKFCLRNNDGNIIYDQAKSIGIAANMKEL